ncbi:MAG: TetR family transcriptional regulator [Solirubrobacteraceae bacterium]|nr:TetR family transcriptional regulator [Solirubrobacteraceae bacterium]
MATENAGTEQEPRRNARGEARKARIIDAALRVVGSRGISGVTHRAVASEAGITPGLITYYFPTVDELLEGTLRSYVDADMERVAAAIQVLEDTGPQADRGAVLGAVFQAVAAEPSEQAAQFELYLESVRRPGLRDVACESLNGYAELGRIAFERLGSDRPEEASRALVAMLDGFAMHQLVDQDDAFIERIGLPAVLALVNAYAPEPS